MSELSSDPENFGVEPETPGRTAGVAETLLRQQREAFLAAVGPALADPYDAEHARQYRSPSPARRQRSTSALRSKSPYSDKPSKTVTVAAEAELFSYTPKAKATVEGLQVPIEFSDEGDSRPRKPAIRTAKSPLIQSPATPKRGTVI